MAPTNSNGRPAASTSTATYPNNSVVSVSASSTSSFQQQGTLNWVELGTMVVKINRDLLRRIALAGIEPLSFEVFDKIGCAYNWTSESEKRFRDALDAYNRAGWILRNLNLYFGVGKDSPSHIFDHSDQSRKILALCASLAQCYETEHGARAMDEWLKQLLAPFPDAAKSIRPSWQQWEALIKASSGVLSTAEFPVVAEDFMRLDGHTRISAITSPCPSNRSDASKSTRKLSRGLASYKDLGQALYALCDLTCGSKTETKPHSLTFIGGADAAFLAAFADQFLGLRTIIRRNDSTHAVLIDKCPPGKKPHVEVLLDVMDQAGGSETGATSSLVKTKEVYLLKDASAFLSKKPGSSPTVDMITGRLRWETALSSTFGLDFTELMDCNFGEGHALGLAIGYAARIYHSVAKAVDVPQAWLNYCRLYFPNSSGVDFVAHATLRFPQLSGATDAMAAGVRASYDDAISRWDQAIERIQVSCDCGCCTTSGKKMRGYCLVAITETIVRMTRYLAGINNKGDGEHEILPQRGGIQTMYDEHIKRMERYSELKRKPSLWREAEWGKQMVVCRILDHVFAGPEPTTMAAAEIIFSAGRFQNDLVLNGEPGQRMSEGQKVSAIESEGLVYYLEILRNPMQRWTNLATVHVTPGTINYMDEKVLRKYEFVTDGPGKTAESKDGNRPQTCLIDAGLLKTLKEAHRGTLELLAQAGSGKPWENGIFAEYGIRTDTSTTCNTDTIAPCSALEGLAKSTGLFHCNGPPYSHAPSNSLKPSIERCERELRDGNPYSSFKYLENTIHVTDRDAATALLLACRGVKSIAVRDECISCCATFGVVQNWLDFAIIKMPPKLKIQILTSPERTKALKKKGVGVTEVLSDMSLTSNCDTTDSDAPLSSSESGYTGRSAGL